MCSRTPALRWWNQDADYFLDQFDKQMAGYATLRDEIETN